MIKRRTLEALGGLKELGIGDQHRYNHVECPSGEDRKRRLYVKRVDNNFWIAYCHHCGEAGAYSNSKDHNFENATELADRLKIALGHDLPEQTDDVSTEVGLVALPADATHDPQEWDTWAVERVMKADMYPFITKWPYNWAFSKAQNQLITPILRWDHAQDMIAMQGRQRPGFIPKTITTYAHGWKGHPLFYQTNSATEDIIICEDPLSAAKIHHQVRCRTMALLGTHLNDSTMNILISTIKHNPNIRIGIWFDPDNAGKKATRAAYQRIAPYLNPRTDLFTVVSAVDPKDADLFMELRPYGFAPVKTAWKA